MSVLEKPARSLEISFQNNRDHAAKTAHLGAGKIVLRMRLKSWIADRFDLRLFFKPSRQLELVRAMTFHPQGERLQAPQNDKSVDGSGDGAARILQKPHSIGKFLGISIRRAPTDPVLIDVTLFG